jgi:thioredoxin 1
MNKGVRIGIVAALAVAVGIVAYVRTAQREPAEPALADPGRTANEGLPRLLDLGSKTCIPCKLMVPVLEDLKKEYAGRMQVEFIDVAENPEAIKTYGIEGIPTQIFYDVSGEERARHWGFMSKADILGKWKELGVTVEPR